MTADRNDTVSEVARTMADERVGSVVIDRRTCLLPDPGSDSRYLVASTSPFAAVPSGTRTPKSSVMM